MEIPVLTTDRLTLRSYRPEEFDFFASMTGNPDVMRYIADAQDRPTSFRAFCATFGHWQVRGHGMWAIEEKATKRLLGHAGLPRWEGSAGMEIGYALHPAAWGQGFATEACIAVRKYAHETMHARDVISVIHPLNLPSIRVVERMGATFQREHTQKGEVLRIYVHPNP